MKSATNTPSHEHPLALPKVATNDVTSGIDWARDDHAVCIVDGRGREVAPTMVEHTAAGLRELVGFLGRHGADEVAHRVAAANQLRAHLRNVLPGTVGLFKDLDSEISLAFLTRFDTQDRADWLTPKRLGE